MGGLADLRRDGAGTRALGSIVALVVALEPFPASAKTADRREPAGAPTEAKPDLGEMWRAAQVRMETSDYTGAIEDLTALYQLIAQDPEAKALRLRVRWTLHEAHLGAYEVERDAKHLLVAKDLLAGYLEDLGEAEAGLREEGQGALDAVEAKIAEHRRAEEEAARAEAEAAKEAEPEEEPTEAALAPVVEPTRPTDDRLIRPDTSARPLIVSGGVLAGLGVIGIGMAIGGFASAQRQIGVFEEQPDRRDEARDKLKVGNAVGLSGAVVGGVLTTTGAVLLVLGMKRKKTGLAASVDPSGFGVTWSGRF